MAHDEHCGCGCHEHDHIDKHFDPAEVTDNQKEFLHQLGHRHFMPVARFSVKSSKEDGFTSTALAPVFIHLQDDNMEQVKGAGEFLQKLEDMGLITLDYDIPLEGYGYEEYKACSLYKYFCETVKEGSSKPGFLGDTPVLELGSMGITEAGEKLAGCCCHHD